MYIDAVTDPIVLRGGNLYFLIYRRISHLSNKFQCVCCYILDNAIVHVRGQGGLALE